MQTGIQALITMAILANPAVGWTDQLPIPSQHGAGPSTATVFRANAGRLACVLTGAEAGEGYRLMQAGHFAEALAKFQSALDRMRPGSLNETNNRACVMNVIGVIEQRQRRLDAAVMWFRRGLDLEPPSEVLVALLTANLAATYGDLGVLDRAEELAREAIRLWERASGADDPETLFPQTTLAFIHAAREEYAIAEPVLRRVLFQVERIWGATSYEFSVAAANLAFVHFGEGKYDLARELFQKSLAGLEGNSARSRGELPLAQATLALSSAAGGRRRDANQWLEQALANAERELSPEDRSLADVLERGAITRFLLRDYESGEQLFNRAIMLLEARHGPGSPVVQSAVERYSDVLRKAEEKTHARELKAKRKELDARRKALALKP